MNAFEIAILRILIKRNGRPLAIYKLIDGFPDGSENLVIDALTSLKKSNFISIIPGIPKEEQYVIHNRERIRDILRIIEHNESISSHTLQDLFPKPFRRKLERIIINKVDKSNSFVSSSLSVTTYLVVSIAISISFLFGGIPVANNLPVFFVNEDSHHGQGAHYNPGNGVNMDFHKISYKWDKSSEHDAVDSSSNYIRSFDFENNCKLT